MLAACSVGSCSTWNACWGAARVLGACSGGSCSTWNACWGAARVLGAYSGGSCSTWNAVAERFPCPAVLGACSAWNAVAVFSLLFHVERCCRAVPLPGGVGCLFCVECDGCVRSFVPRGTLLRRRTLVPPVPGFLFHVEPLFRPAWAKTLSLRAGGLLGR